MQPTTQRTEPGCDFCEIASHAEPARVVFRTADVVAFFPDEPAILGHTLLIPVSHVTDIWDLREELAAELAARTVGLAHAIRRVINPDGLNVIQSNGAAATQTVMHLHVHVVPRWATDDLGRIWPPETHYSEAQKDATWDALRAQFAGPTT